jgi:hypothetical protein
MEAKLREEKLKELTENEPYATKDMTYKNSTEKLAVYQIPVDYLVFNQYNGRIGTYVKTYEKQYVSIDPSTKEGEKIIVDFLWKSKKKRNEETLKDIADKGQLEYGIVTKDGVVIDGNRRCMLLKKLNKTSPTYFKAVILDDTLESNPKEIRKLETIYQMGVDEKVDYNAIEKYLKCQDLLSDDFTHEEIGNMMGEKETKIKEYLEILELMEDYLKAYGYEGMYTRLDEQTVEGPFVDLRGYLERQRSGTRVRGRDWEPETDDMDDLKQIYFDYIRAGFRTAHDIRDIGNPSKGQGFFNREQIWNEFKDRYFKEIGPINDEERTLEALRQEAKGDDIDKVIAARDEDWTGKVFDLMRGNIGRTKRSLEDHNEANSPAELLGRAKSTLDAIDPDLEAFCGEEIKQLSHEIRKIVEAFIDIIKKKEKNK